MRFGLCLAWLLVVVVSYPGRVEADDLARARAAYEAGQQRFVAGDYRGAIQRFKAAEQLAARKSKIAAALAFNIGRCHEKLGNFAWAASRYREYLELQPDAADRLEVARKIGELEELTRRLAVKPGPEPSVIADAAATPVVLHVDRSRRPLVKQLRWTWAAAGTTAALLVGAAIASALVPAKYDELKTGCGATPAGCTPAQLEGLTARVNAANALWAVAGVAAVATGVVLWWEWRSVRRRTAVSFAPLASGGVMLSGWY